MLREPSHPIRAGMTVDRGDPAVHVEPPQVPRGHRGSELRLSSIATMCRPRWARRPSMSERYPVLPLESCKARQSASDTDVTPEG
ncbi:hypothetical protein GCM10011490_10180 [Pseudoclavibacter endophyticus]|nr:hypothetical protein GCM10011490_10180 [Pseudoclavibacter endophyticus]